MEKVKVIGFDADDTLWVNEPYFREAETVFYKLMESYQSQDKIAEELFRVEVKNLEKYGYGIKGFILSMMETALNISQRKISAETMGKIMDR
jgi:putative hydrolase of the HAD superfamily